MARASSGLASARPGKTITARRRLSSRGTPRFLAGGPPLLPGPPAAHTVQQRKGPLSCRARPPSSSYADRSWPMIPLIRI